VTGGGRRERFCCSGQGQGISEEMALMEAQGAMEKGRLREGGQPNS
jgi:hypothetical protein